MQKAKEKGQVPRQEDMEKVHGNMQKMHTRYYTIDNSSNYSKSILNHPK